MRSGSSWRLLTRQRAVTLDGFSILLKPGATHAWGVGLAVWAQEESLH